MTNSVTNMSLVRRHCKIAICILVPLYAIPNNIRTRTEKRPCRPLHIAVIMVKFLFHNSDVPFYVHLSWLCAFHTAISPGAHKLGLYTHAPFYAKQREKPVWTRLVRQRQSQYIMTRRFVDIQHGQKNELLKWVLCIIHSLFTDELIIDKHSSFCVCLQKCYLLQACGDYIYEWQEGIHYLISQ